MPSPTSRSADPLPAANGRMVGFGTAVGSVVAVAVGATVAGAMVDALLAVGAAEGGTVGAAVGVTSGVSFPPWLEPLMNLMLYTVAVLSENSSAVRAIVARNSQNHHSFRIFRY